MKAKKRQNPNPWPEYERRKRELSPDLSPEEYREAVKKICRDLKI